MNTKSFLGKKVCETVCQRVVRNTVITVFHTLAENLLTVTKQQGSALDYSFSDTSEYTLYQTSRSEYLRSRPMQSLQTTQPLVIAIPTTEHVYTNDNTAACNINPGHRTRLH
ncbi:hypothetical protein PR048_024167 [Dryococelus australis]|uniref:Uncharacterized protein n=1 Tax=Dryococelus australis TaxID=614101 RepID=A0ABQ9GW50_9NEOP|nr:hypothetical protein PR048_024167 [Dryococelus australis]